MATSRPSISRPPSVEVDKRDTAMSDASTERHPSLSDGALLSPPATQCECVGGSSGHGGTASLNALAFFYRLRKRPMQRLQAFLSEEDNRSRVWRDLARSGRQLKANRHGVLGIGVGEYAERELQLLSDRIVYEHTTTRTKSKEIAFTDIAYVRGVGGSRTSRWMIKVNHGPDYHFTADSPKSRNAWVWCVRNNVEAAQRRAALETAHGSVGWREGVHSSGHDAFTGQLDSTSLASPVKCRSVTALPKLSEGLAEGCKCGRWE